MRVVLDVAAAAGPHGLPKVVCGHGSYAWGGERAEALVVWLQGLCIACKSSGAEESLSVAMSEVPDAVQREMSGVMNARRLSK